MAIKQISDLTAGTIADTDALAYDTSAGTTLKSTIATFRKNLFASPAQGDVLYYSGTDWVRLGAGTSGQFLKTLGAAANPAWASTGYALQGAAYQINPADGITYYIGNMMPFSPINAPGYDYIDVPKAGTLTSMYVRWMSIGGAAGSNENISMYIGKNNGDYALIETIGDTNTMKVFNNASLALAVAAGDALDVKLVCPTWGTNPTNTVIKWTAWIDTP